MAKSTVYNSRKSRDLIAQANSHNFLCKIGDGENVVTRVDKAAPGPHDDTRVRPNLDREWYHFMASSPRVGYTEQVLN